MIYINRDGKIMKEPVPEKDINYLTIGNIKIIYIPVPPIRNKPSKPILIGEFIEGPYITVDKNWGDQCLYVKSAGEALALKVMKELRI